jgi:divalent metal cation (Fe/Co/Zn/Cd) transporter
MNLALPRGGSVGLAVALLWATIAWNSIEGIIALTASFVSGSVALLGFGLDSFIEVGAAAVLIWRLGVPVADDAADRRELTCRRIIGASFLLLACVVLGQAAYVTFFGSPPEESGAGLVLAVASLILMPALALAKRSNAQALHSHALIAESTETFVCAYLSFTLFIGLAANALFGWGWADVAAALAMVPWIVKEGIDGIRGQSCWGECGLDVPTGGRALPRSSP